MFLLGVLAPLFRNWGDFVVDDRAFFYFFHNKCGGCLRCDKVKTWRE